MPDLVKAMFTILMPLCILLLGMNAAVFAGSAIASLGHKPGSVALWWGFLPVVDSSRVSAALIVVNLGALVLFAWRLRVPINTARQNNMSFFKFSLLSLATRRTLIESTSPQKIRS